MSGHPIQYFDRYAGSVRQEAVYGEGALRLAYGSGPGRMLSRLFFSRPLLSRLFGWYMSRPASVSRIRPFIEQYGIDESEFVIPKGGFRSFNEFFHRELKEGARPVDPHPASVVFPADGRHLGWEEVGPEQAIFAKGQKWDLPGLLGGDRELAACFEGGGLVLSRLCPVDYHHFHSPVGGRVEEVRWIGERLFSVSPYALRQNIRYLWENKRCLNLIRTEKLGLVCFIEIGATNVGTIRHSPLAPGRLVFKGAEKGWFEFGGSSVITIFQRGRVALAGDLLEQTCQGRELYARTGDRMGLVR